MLQDSDLPGGPPLCRSATSFVLVVLVTLACSVGCSVLAPSGGAETTPPTLAVHAIRANSVGYVVGRQKTVTVVLPAGTTSLPDVTADVWSAASNSVVWSCAVTGPMYDPDTGTNVYLGDFTPFDEPGDYFITVPRSPSTANRHAPPRSTSPPTHFATRSRARCSACTASVAGQAVNIRLGNDHWSHGACHLNDAYLDYLTGAMSKKASVGGWHDAGDYGKYVTNGAFSAGMMLAAWEHFQPMLSTLFAAIPEHGGAIPDFLAEVKWELDWLLTTQGDDGGVSHKVTALAFEGFMMPEGGRGDPVLHAGRDRGHRRSRGGPGEGGADLPALRSDAGGQVPGGGAPRLRVPVRDRRSARPRHRRDLQHRRLRRKGPTPATGYGRPPSSGRRPASPPSSPISRPGSRSAASTAPSTGAPSRTWACSPICCRKQTGRDPTLVDGAHELGDDGRATCSPPPRSASPFGRAISGYWWGSNGTVARAAMNLWVAYQLNGDTLSYLDAIQMQLDHLLGRNIYDRTQVTGVGYNPPPGTAPPPIGERRHRRPVARPARWRQQPRRGVVDGQRRRLSGQRGRHQLGGGVHLRHRRADAGAVTRPAFVIIFYDG